jgi:hypothetical protein
MSVGFTGTRRGLTERQSAALVHLLARTTTLHHGGAIGADQQAEIIARQLGIATIVHLPAGTRSTDYLARNREIVDVSAELFAAPDGPERMRSGTWATVRYARKQQRP